MDRVEEVRSVFEEYHARQGADRNDGYTNPGVRLQDLYSTLSLVDALASTRLDRIRSEVLDVGAGDGASLAIFMSVGFPYQCLHGIDIVPEYVRVAGQRWPHLDVRAMDATSMTFPDAMFDIVTSSGLFIQITDDQVASAIANEMVRVLKPGGHLLVRDWWFPHPDRSHYRPLGQVRRQRLFSGNPQLKFQGSHRGPLVPPLGRWLSRNARWLYGPVHALLPFLAAQKTWVWQKA